MTLFSLSKAAAPTVDRGAGSARLPASIEVSPRQAIESADLPSLFPKGTRVSITDMGLDIRFTQVMAAKRLRDLGYVPIPHIAVRRVRDLRAMDDRIRAISQEGGVRDVLVIAGGLEKPVGTFSGAMDVLETGVFDKYGIRDIAVAGHPEGSPDFSESVAIEVLKLKQDFGERTGARMRIVTQFGFDGRKFAEWAGGLSAHGIDLPVHIGVAGPAKLTTMVKYAAMCGVGSSVSFLKKRGGSIATLMGGFSPDEVVDPIEAYAHANPASRIAQIHVFPFGGIKAAAAWLFERGTWADKREGGA
ncbi:methylenetetrahydrofolate reductase [Chelativorans salis]|uniref:Methylenetetrahydrofolate reductase n=1 Tax=Chelativorans salis TaxID=2978478 RepID=A0ABT2LQ07_9HYPH|nr:methylenetetrahydrofolate reductase [Chelativorans sp. EGI FJ00035]MCT7376640.1 methylenetetrahydrofolate reductase [Chelativorans sp. EGI FJ00035]